MDSYSDIISKRALSGVMIFNSARELIYVNEEANKFLRKLMDASDAAYERALDTDPVVPEQVISLCDDLGVQTDGEKDAQKHFVYKSFLCGGEDFLLRAIPIRRIKRDADTSHVMVTVEKFSTRLTADVKKVGARFKLTKREIEVLTGVVRGMTNKDISALLFISEYTVKDHVKSIMQKISVKNRSLLICRVFAGNQ